MTGPTDRKKWLTFSDVPVPDTDSGSLFHFPHQCRIRNFRRFLRFLSVSHTAAGCFSQHSAKWLTPTTSNSPLNSPGDSTLQWGARQGLLCLSPLIVLLTFTFGRYLINYCFRRYYLAIPETIKQTIRLSNQRHNVWWIDNNNNNKSIVITRVIVITR